MLIHGGKVLRPGKEAVEALDIVLDGETIADLAPFDPEAFVHSLFFEE